MLAFLLQKYQVGGVRFLRESTPAGDQVVTKRGPTFLILIDVFHQPEDLLYLLDFVQRTRKEFIKEKSHLTGKTTSNGSQLILINSISDNFKEKLPNLFREKSKILTP